MKAQVARRGGAGGEFRSVTLLILNFGARWLTRGQRHAVDNLVTEKSHIAKEAGWGSYTVWSGVGQTIFLISTGVRILDRTACRELIY